MAQPTRAPKRGDKCPSCGGTFQELRQLTPDERRRATDRENPVNYGPFVDSADPDLIDKQGPLARCTTCGYKTRFAPQDDDAARRDERQAAAPPPASPRPATTPPPPAPPASTPEQPPSTPAGEPA